MKLALCAPLLLACRCAAASDSPVPALLASRCQICHNDQPRAGGLSLQSMEGMRKGSKRGPAVVPGHPEKSILYQLIPGGKPAMPLVGEPLTKAQVESVRQ